MVDEKAVLGSLVYDSDLPSEGEVDGFSRVSLNIDWVGGIAWCFWVEGIMGTDQNPVVIDVCLSVYL
jgi:hypothetical protein